MAVKTSTTVKTGNFQSDFTLLQENFLHLHQVRCNEKPAEIAEAWGNIWSLAVADVPQGLVAMRSGDTIIPVEGKVGIFLPPYSIVEWIVQPGQFEFEVLFSTIPLPGTLPDLAVSFRYEQQRTPSSPQEALGIVAAAGELTVVERGIDPHPVAKELKSLIRSGFNEECSLGELAERLSTSPAFLARKFKNSYGIQPVNYRSQLRVHESMRMLLMEHSSVIDAGFKIGFQDLSRFNKQFRKHLGAPPSKYKIDTSLTK